MRIGDGNPAGANPARPREATKGNEAVGQTAPQRPDAGKDARLSEADSDAVGLSSLSHALTASSAGTSRIDELRLQVQQGTYEVPAEELAKKIVDFHTK
jgi:flagellar biosynthesis anti-sigma factor FlgM